MLEEIEYYDFSYFSSSLPLIIFQAINFVLLDLIVILLNWENLEFTTEGTLIFHQFFVNSTCCPCDSNLGNERNVKTKTFSMTIYNST